MFSIALFYQQIDLTINNLKMVINLLIVQFTSSVDKECLKLVSFKWSKLEVQVPKVSGRNMRYNECVLCMEKGFFCF